MIVRPTSFSKYVSSGTSCIPWYSQVLPLIFGYTPVTLWLIYYQRAIPIYSPIFQGLGRNEVIMIYPDGSILMGISPQKATWCSAPGLRHHLHLLCSWLAMQSDAIRRRRCLYGMAEIVQCRIFLFISTTYLSMYKSDAEVSVRFFWEYRAMDFSWCLRGVSTSLQHGREALQPRVH